MNYQKIAHDLVGFMGGIESNVSPTDVASELEQTETVDYEVYDDNINEIKPADGINIIQLIAEPFHKYKNYMKDVNLSSEFRCDYTLKSIEKENAYINSVYTKNKNDTIQEMDERILKAYNTLTNIVTNKKRMEKTIGSYDDPFVGEGIILTHILFMKVLLALIPFKLEKNTSLFVVAQGIIRDPILAILDTAEFIISIQSKLSTKIYYKAPLTSEITGERIDTISKTKYDIINNPGTTIRDINIQPSENREDSGLRDNGREVLVTGAVESIENIIEIRNHNALAEFAQLITKLTRIAFMGNIPLYFQMVECLDKAFKSPTDVMGGITACIGVFNTKIIDPINLQYKKFEMLREEYNKSLTDNQFATKDIENSLAAKVEISKNKPNIDDFEF